jgi:hypothetical protein
VLAVLVAALIGVAATGCGSGNMIRARNLGEPGSRFGREQVIAIVAGQPVFYPIERKDLGVSQAWEYPPPEEPITEWAIALPRAGGTYADDDTIGNDALAEAVSYALQRLGELEMEIEASGDPTRVSFPVRATLQGKPGDGVAVVALTITEVNPGSRAGRIFAPLTGWGAGAVITQVEGRVTDSGTGATLFEFRDRRASYRGVIKGEAELQIRENVRASIHAMFGALMTLWIDEPAAKQDSPGIIEPAGDDAAGSTSATVGE